MRPDNDSSWPMSSPCFCCVEPFKYFVKLIDSMGRRAYSELRLSTSPAVYVIARVKQLNDLVEHILIFQVCKCYQEKT